MRHPQLSRSVIYQHDRESAIALTHPLQLRYMCAKKVLRHLQRLVYRAETITMFICSLEKLFNYLEVLALLSSLALMLRTLCQLGWL